MKIELDYVKVGDYYLPDLTIEPPPDRSLGKYGLLRLRYLKEHRPIVWAELVMEGILIAYYTADENTEVDAVTSASVVAVDGEDKGRVRSVADMIRR